MESGFGSFGKRLMRTQFFIPEQMDNLGFLAFCWPNAEANALPPWTSTIAYTASAALSALTGVSFFRCLDLKGASQFCQIC